MVTTSEAAATFLVATRACAEGCSGFPPAALNFGVLQPVVVTERAGRRVLGYPVNVAVELDPAARIDAPQLRPVGARNQQNRVVGAQQTAVLVVPELARMPDVG